MNVTHPAVTRGRGAEGDFFFVPFALGALCHKADPSTDSVAETSLSLSHKKANARVPGPYCPLEASSIHFVPVLLH